MPDRILPSGSWAIDPDATSTMVKAKNLLVKSVPVTLRIRSGHIVVADDGRLTSLEAVIDASSVDSNNSRRDDHLRSGDFLDASVHPEIVLSASSAVAHGDDYVIDASLAVKGISKPITLTCSNIEIDHDRARFAVSGQIERTTIGLSKMPSIMIGKMLEIEVSAVADRS